MSNCLNYCINYVKRHIPVEILDLGFKRDKIFNTQGVTLDDKLFKSVYLNILKRDLDLVTGVPISIKVNDCHIVQSDTVQTFIITVPKALTDYRSLTSVRSLVPYMNLGNLGMTNQNLTSPYLFYGQKVMNALDTVTISSTSRLEIIGDNKILIQDPSIYPGSGILECEVEHGPNLETVVPKFYGMVAELFLQATKIYIRTNILIDLNEGHIIGGHDISIIKDEVEKYEEATERYKELLQDWKQLGIFNSTKNKANIIRLFTSQRS